MGVIVGTAGVALDATMMAMSANVALLVVNKHSGEWLVKMNKAVVNNTLHGGESVLVSMNPSG